MKTAGSGVCVALALALMSGQGASEVFNGFVIGEDSLIPVDDIHHGGPPRDGIPAIDRPVFVAAEEAEELQPRDAVLGLTKGGVAKAYPVAIMNWHEIVNDRFGDEPVVITYCPLCGSGVAYTAIVQDREATFGVSGLLFNSDVLLYDRETESLWSQMLSQAVTGPLRGTRLTMLPLVHTTWKEWRTDHPGTRVLSRRTGFIRDYDRDPYAGYTDSAGIYFPVSRRDPRYHPKERVLGVELDGRFKAYPVSELSKVEGGKVLDRFNQRELVIRYRPDSGSAQAFGPDGEEIPAINAFWFAWYAFHPDTEVFVAP